MGGFTKNSLASRWKENKTTSTVSVLTDNYLMHFSAKILLVKCNANEIDNEQLNYGVNEKDIYHVSEIETGNSLPN